MEYTQTPIEDLIPYVNNSRTHSDEQVLQIASSIKEFGFLNPVIIDQDNGIIAGHGRLMAAKLLKLDYVPTLLVDHLSEAQKKAYVIADNQLALNSGWDFDVLRVEIENLKEHDFDVGLLGFDDKFFNNLFDDSEIGEVPPEEADPANDEIGLYVFVKSETEQQNVFEEMEKRGYKCKLIG